MSNLDKYKGVFTNTFQLSDAANFETIKYQSLEEWDSIGHLTLMSNIEIEFEISLEMDDIIDFNSFLSGIEILKKYDVQF